MSHTFSRRRQTTIALLVAATLGLGASVVVANDQGKPDLALLADASVPQSDIPEFFVEGAANHHVDLTTMHRLASDHEWASFWTATSMRGDVCLIVTTGDESASTTCAAPKDFNTHGLGTRLLTSQHAVEVYLIPDAVAMTNNILMVDPRVAVSVEELQGAGILAPPEVLKDERFTLELVTRGDESWRHAG